MAPTYIVNFVALVFLAARLLNWDIPYTPDAVQNALTILVVLGTPIFTLIRQVWTGRSTVFGTVPKRS